jgi:hypothetical protein
MDNVRGMKHKHALSAILVTVAWRPSFRSPNEETAFLNASIRKSIGMNKA